MNKKAFTLVEVLLAMTIVGIIAAVTANSLGNISANKTKMAFQNNYKHMEEVIQSIVTDETIYPIIKLNTLDTMGKEERVSMCKYDAEMFPKEFLNHTKVTSQSAVTGGYSFETPSGALWVVTRHPSNSNTCINSDDNINGEDYVITFDVNGLAEGTNCPYTGSTLSDEVSGTCNNPDTFKFFLRAYDNTLVSDRNLKYGKDNRFNSNMNLTSYLKQNNYLDFK